jgi:hypothetical protein
VNRRTIVAFGGLLLGILLAGIGGSLRIDGLTMGVCGITYGMLLSMAIGSA